MVTQISLLKPGQKTISSDCKSTLFATTTCDFQSVKESWRSSCIACRKQTSGNGVSVEVFSGSAITEKQELGKREIRKKRSENQWVCVSKLTFIECIFFARHYCEDLKCNNSLHPCSNPMRYVLLLSSCDTLNILPNSYVETLCPVG